MEETGRLLAAAEGEGRV